MPGRDRGDRKSGHRKDGTSIWTHAAISGLGIWATCIKGKERQCAGELIDLFEELAGELYPEIEEAGSSSISKNNASSAPVPTSRTALEGGDSDDDDIGLSVEEQVAREVAKLRRPQKQKRFANFQTNTACVVFISVRTPVDPVKVVLHHISNVQRTGISRTRHTHRLVPSSGTCTTVMPDMKALMSRLVRQYFDSTATSEPNTGIRYKIELRIRNHNTFDRPTILKELAECVPPEHKVDLTDPEVFVLVEVMKSTCGIAIVRDYYALSKFNVVELAQAVASERTVDAQVEGTDADAIYARLS